MRGSARFAAIAGWALSASCLHPLADDTVDPAHFFGDPNIDPATAPHVEDDPTFKTNVQQFSSAVAYLDGYADGQKIWYWNINGIQTNFISQFYEIQTPDGKLVGRRIIDAIPGQTGYTPWWRRVILTTTSKYNKERIWSRDAVDAAIQAGLLEQAQITTEVYDCPVALRGTQIPVDLADTKATTEWVWYRNMRVDWIMFTNPIQVPEMVKEMPVFPVYVLKRVDQAQPIYELLDDTDLNGDGDLKDTNNVFASNIGGSRFSLYWYVSIVNVVPTYPSFDNTRTGTVGISAESDFLDANGAIISPYVDEKLGLTPMKTFTVNCPLQSMKGSL
jgi:hypothetical protein